MKKKPILYIIVPCYNEEDVLPVTNTLFVKKLFQLIKNNEISNSSRILYVNDGSTDRTWELIKKYAKEIQNVVGLSQSRNRGHQNAVYAGLMESKDLADITISIDCDGQDDINAMDEMIKAYKNGAEIVYGIRNDRDTDTFFKRYTAQSFYKLLEKMGVETIYNHADYRLVSSKVLKEFENLMRLICFLEVCFHL